MSIPTQHELHEEVDRLFFDANPDAPRPLDRHDGEQAEWVRAWDELAERTAGEWANAVFVERFPDAGFIDPNDPADAEYLDYWLDWRDQILHGAHPRHNWDAGRMDIEVKGDAPLQDVIAFADTADDFGLVGSIVDNEQAILRQWKAALDTFVAHLEGPTADEANPDFAGAVLEQAIDYAVGEVKKALKPLEHVLPGSEAFGVLEALYGAYETAGKAAARLKVRDFLAAHVASIADLDHGFQMLGNSLRSDVKLALDGIRANPHDGAAQHAYLGLHGALSDWDQSAQLRASVADYDAYMSWLASEWLRTSETVAAHPVDAHAVIRLERDWTVRDAKLVGETAKKVLEGLEAHHPGEPIDLWALEIPRRVVLFAEGEAVYAVARVDASGQPESGHTEFDGEWEWLQEQLPKLPGGWAATTNLSASSN